MDTDKQKRKLSFRELREIEELPDRIDALETEQQHLSRKMTDPGFYRNHEEVKITTKRLSELEQELSAAYERWEYLESIASST